MFLIYLLAILLDVSGANFVIYTLDCLFIWCVILNFFMCMTTLLICI